LVSLSGSTKKFPISGRCQVYQATFVSIQGVPFIVVASTLGVQIWTSEGSEVKYFFSVGSLTEAEDGIFIYLD